MDAVAISRTQFFGGVLKHLIRPDWRSISEPVSIPSISGVQKLCSVIIILLIWNKNNSV